jgi:hypothetical protein
MKSVKKKNTQHTFILTNINITETDIKYSIYEPASTQSQNIFKVDNNTETTQFVTTIQELQNISHIQSNIDDTNIITMIDSIKKSQIERTFCFWCRNAFDGRPIGCPIRYVSSKIHKKCISDISKESYVINQSITEKSCMSYTPKDNELISHGYYETDGVFCTFNCCLAWIEDNYHDPLYKNSSSLLLKLYTDIFKPTKIVKIFPAPSWRLLVDYGGTLSIENFRKSFNEYYYQQQTTQVKSVVQTRPIGYIFKKEYIF